MSTCTTTMTHAKWDNLEICTYVRILTHSLSLSLSLVHICLLGDWLADCFRVRLSSHLKKPEMVKKRDTPWANRNHETQLPNGSPTHPPSFLKKPFFFTFWTSIPTVTRGTYTPITYTESDTNTIIVTHTCKVQKVITNPKPRPRGHHLSASWGTPSEPY